MLFVYFYIRAIILGPEVPSMVDYPVEISHVMNSSRLRGSEDPASKQAPSIEWCVPLPGLCYD
jgi:hypothetical protein